MNELIKRNDLENQIDTAYKVYAQHQTELLQDTFNSLQMLYHALYDIWYVPAQAVIVEETLWERAIPLPDPIYAGFNHE